MRCAIATQFLNFTIKPGHNGAVTLTYKIGGGHDVGGAATVTAVKGADDKDETGDKWKVYYGVAAGERQRHHHEQC